MTTTLDRLQTILTHKFSVPAENVQPDAMLESFDLDSLDLIEVLFEVEDEFKIRIPQDADSSLKKATIADLVEKIDKLQVAKREEQDGAA